MAMTWSDGTENGHVPGVSVDATGAPLGFFENLGQFPDPDVMLYQGLSYGGAAFTEDGVVMSVREPGGGGLLRALMDRDLDRKGPDSELSALLEQEVAGHTVRLSFVGANDVMPVGRDQLSGEHNFLIGNDPGAWRTGVRSYSQVVYEDLWEGIDLVYTLTDAGLKYEFLVSPGADPSRVRVSVNGHEGLSVVDGDLVISTSVGDIVDGGLSVFHQDQPDVTLPAAFSLLDGNTYTIAVQGRDADRTLVIDPWVFATFLGGNGEDAAVKVDVDSDGDIYTCGISDSGNFPTTTGAFQAKLAGFLNVIVSKVSADGSSLVFSTYLGGDFYDFPNSMYVDPAEDVYLCGDTYSSNFPVTAGAYQNRSTGSSSNFTADSFVTKLDASGSRLDYSTYLGADSDGSLLGMTVDGSGNAYVTGWTTSFNMTTSAGAYQTSKASGDWYWDAIVRVLDPTGGRQIYATYLGGSDDDEGWDIELNATGVVFVTGLTYSDDFPITSRAYQSNLNRAITAGFVTKLKPDLSDLHYSTYLGGSEDQELYSIVLDSNDNATVTGYTYSTDYPVTQNAYDKTLNTDDMDIVVSTLSADGSSLVYSTFLGKDGEDNAREVQISQTGDIHVAGYTYSPTFPTTTGAVSSQMKGDSDGIYAVLKKDLSDLVMGTYVGGKGEDVVLSVKPVGNIDGYLAGMTYSSDFPVTAGAYQIRHGGGEMDAVLGQISFDSLPPIAEAGLDVTIDQHDTVDFDGSACSDNIEVVNWSWEFFDGDRDVVLYGTDASYTFHIAGVYSVTLTVADGAAMTAFDSLTVTVTDITRPEADAGSLRSIDQHDTVVFDGLDSTDNVAVANWTWSFIYDGEGVTLYGPGPEFTFDEAGEYNVTLMVIDAMGLSDIDWVSIIVMDIEEPMADAGLDIEVDQHQAVTFNAVGSTDNVGIVNWTWSFVYQGMPIRLYDATAGFTFDDAGSYEVALSVSDKMGNLDRDTLTVRVVDITPPLADAGDDLEVIQGSTVHFDGRGSTDNVRLASYTWNLEYQDVPIELYGNTPTYYFEAAGVYLVTLTITDMENNTATDTMWVTVLDTTAPDADGGDDITIDQGDTASFNGLASTDNVIVVSWTWTFIYRGEKVELTGSTATHVFEDAGVYTVDLRVLDAAGGSSDDDLRVIVVDITAPVAAAGDDRTSDQGQAVTLDGSGSTDNLGITRFTWTFEYGGGTEELTGRTVQFPFDVPGDYTVTLTATDEAGNSATDSFDLHVRDTVRPTPPPMSDIEASAGEKVTMDAQGSIDNVGVVKWTWTFKEDGKTVTLEGAKVSHTFETAGDYKVTLIVEDAEGNQATTDFDVQVAGSSWLWIAMALVVVVVVVAVVVMMRRSGAGED